MIGMQRPIFNQKTSNFDSSPETISPDNLTSEACVCVCENTFCLKCSLEPKTKVSNFAN